MLAAARDVRQQRELRLAPIRRASRCACLLGLLVMGVSLTVRAQGETVLHRFGAGPTDGYEPDAPLLLDASGNLFGTTTEGSETLCDLAEVFGCGIVFELVKSNGYAEEILYNFGANSPATDGASPYAGLIVDAAGNLYGTTTYGGSSNCLIDMGVDGCGTVFELVKSSTGYTEKVLYAFTGYDGAYPMAGLIMDSSGNLYGTASGGGANGYGDVFELVNSAGTYTYTVLYSFGSATPDGAYPVAGLAMDSAGDLYGTTSLDTGPFSCGLSSCGTVFELVNSANGYSEKTLHTFSESEGANPDAGLIMDVSGNLYGTASQGGANGSGTAFELVNSSGAYTAKVLYSFGANSSDGVMPLASLVMDTSGNLYGTTKMGGSATACGGYGCGTAFELVNAAGSYTEKVLHGFGSTQDGENPAAALVIDGSGKLYSTTEVGGSQASGGTVFEITPSAAAPVPELSATNLSFDTVVNTSSAPQGIIVTNTGAANLVFGPTGVSLSGVNASEFTTSDDTCSGRSIAPQGMCSVALTFAPTIAATETATANFSDNAVVSIQQVSLTGLGLTLDASVSLLPTVLTFGNQTVLTTSEAQQVTLMNTGGTSLTISRISVGAGFTETSNCGSNLSSDGSCQIQVSFAPTTGGQQVADLEVMDSAADSPQTVSLIGTGADFTIGFGAGASQSVTVSAGQTASYPLIVTPEGAFSQSVKFACAGVPASARCTISPDGVMLNGTGNVPFTVNVTTTAAGVLPPGRTPPISRLAPLTCLIWVAALWMVWLAAGRQTGRVRRLARPMMLLALIAAVTTCSCGGGQSSSTPPGPTPAGTYTLTVTGTSGDVSNSITLTLVVN